MFKNISDQFGSVLVALLSLQSVCSAFAVETNLTLNETYASEEKGLAARTSDDYTIVHKWNGGDVIGPATGVGLVITGAVGIIVSWYNNRPDPQKICGKSAIIDVSEDGIDYEYYVYSYTTGDNCDSTQRTKTITKKLSDAMNDLNSQGASAVCLDLDHHGTWHGVLGLATKSSGKNPQTACDGHHAGARSGSIGFLEPEGNITAQIEGKDTTRRNENGLPPEKSQGIIAEISGKIYSLSKDASCAGISGTMSDSNGVSITYYYYASGRNCDTTAEIQTIVHALDDAWNGLGGTSALCMTMRHGHGTWRGHLGVSAMQGDFPATQLC
ncbi:hypothetical protein N7541_004251 [Penicillium brevicompactum]|uniref:Secreted protein CSS2 C-terminal domain-containing protein n=1 Tax=Penicillium brevicompactum TaxID=5074 RepID=A0A9W9RNI6_PENBR|nr:hypothetical protein N7541_004251 [Penicillium brevicompactum]